MTIELTPRAAAPINDLTGLTSSSRSARRGNDAPHAADIRISILSDHEWRICDRRIPENNAECVLGYIDKTAGLYEVMKLSSTRNLLYYSDLEQAISSFTSQVKPAAVGRVF
ncbi:MAG: hypothetical protein JWQ19_2363 [Subtercola sp.]|nr:hypothetical protein [Subtercola sp.]